MASQANDPAAGNPRNGSVDSLFGSEPVSEPRSAGSGDANLMGEAAAGGHESFEDLALHVEPRSTENGPALPGGGETHDVDSSSLYWGNNSSPTLDGELQGWVNGLVTGNNNDNVVANNNVQNDIPIDPQLFADENGGGDASQSQQQEGFEASDLVLSTPTLVDGFNVNFHRQDEENDRDNLSTISEEVQSLSEELHAQSINGEIPELETVDATQAQTLPMPSLPSPPPPPHARPGPPSHKTGPTRRSSRIQQQHQYHQQPPLLPTPAPRQVPVGGSSELVAMPGGTINPDLLSINPDLLSNNNTNRAVLPPAVMEPRASGTGPVSHDEPYMAAREDFHLESYNQQQHQYLVGTVDHQVPNNGSMMGYNDGAAMGYDGVYEHYDMSTHVQDHGQVAAISHYPMTTSQYPPPEPATYGAPIGDHFNINQMYPVNGPAAQNVDMYGNLMVSQYPMPPSQADVGSWAIAQPPSHVPLSRPQSTHPGMPMGLPGVGAPPPHGSSRGATPNHGGHVQQPHHRHHNQHQRQQAPPGRARTRQAAAAAPADDDDDDDDDDNDDDDYHTRRGKKRKRARRAAEAGGEGVKLQNGRGKSNANEEFLPEEIYEQKLERVKPWGMDPHRANAPPGGGIVAGPTNTKPLFRYNRYGEWEATMDPLDSVQLDYYIAHQSLKRPGLDEATLERLYHEDPLRFQQAEELLNCLPPRLVIWVQHPPFGRMERYTDGNPEKSIGINQCRWHRCPDKMRKIKKGFFRVCFDERPTATGFWIDPWMNAGYMHLWCFEQACDLPELPSRNKRGPGFQNSRGEMQTFYDLAHGGGVEVRACNRTNFRQENRGAFIVQADDRVFPFEKTNLMALTRDDKGKKSTLKMKCNKWLQQYEARGLDPDYEYTRSQPGTPTCISQSFAHVVGIRDYCNIKNRPNLPPGVLLPPHRKTPEDDYDRLWLKLTRHKLANDANAKELARKLRLGKDISLHQGDITVLGIMEEKWKEDRQKFAKERKEQPPSTASTTSSAGRRSAGSSAGRRGRGRGANKKSSPKGPPGAYPQSGADPRNPAKKRRLN